MLNSPYIFRYPNLRYLGFSFGCPSRLVVVPQPTKDSACTGRRPSSASSSVVYIISHHSDELNIPVDNILHVIKDKEGNSTITL